MYRLIQGLLIASFFLSHSYAQTLQEEIDGIVYQQFKDDGPGVAILVAKAGKIIYRKAIGKANLELDVEMQPEHIFRIGSITKQFTACAILRLSESGKLKLSDKLSKYIPDYPEGDQITIKHLLNHTSGIKSYTGMKEWTPETHRKDFTPQEMVDFFKDQPMDFEAGTDYRYNNSAYFLLGHLIEIISAKTYAEFLREEFFDPLGMNNTYYDVSADIIPNRIPGYGGTADHPQNAPYLSMTQPYAAGSLLSNVDDIYRWYQAVMDGKVISDRSRDLAHSYARLNNGDSLNYGLGWSLSFLQREKTIEHGGGIHGFLTSSIYIPEHEVFVAAFSNCNCNSPELTANKIAALVMDKPLVQKPLKVPPSILADYVGIYQKDEEERTITADHGKLYSMRQGGSRHEIVPFAEDQFYFQESFNELKFERNRSGEVVSALFRGRTFPSRWIKTEREVEAHQRVDVEQELLQTYAGQYKLEGAFILTITAQEQRLTATPEGQEPLELFPKSNSVFFAPEMDVQIEFVQIDNQVTALIVNQGGQKQEFKRIN